MLIAYFFKKKCERGPSGRAPGLATPWRHVTYVQAYYKARDLEWYDIEKFSCHHSHGKNKKTDIIKIEILWREMFHVRLFHIVEIF